MVKSQYINITGYKVIIVNTEAGGVVYQVTVIKNYPLINVEDMGITGSPLRARIIVLRY